MICQLFSNSPSILYCSFIFISFCKPLMIWNHTVLMSYFKSINYWAFSCCNRSWRTQFITMWIIWVIIILLNKFFNLIVIIWITTVMSHIGIQHFCHLSLWWLNFFLCFLLYYFEWFLKLQIFAFFFLLHFSYWLWKLLSLHQFFFFHFFYWLFKLSIII